MKNPQVNGIGLLSSQMIRIRGKALSCVSRHSRKIVESRCLPPIVHNYTAWRSQLMWKRRR